MSSVRSNNGKLFFDLRIDGQRCREYTKLPSNATNQKTMQKVLNKIEAEILLGTFDYAAYFPGSKNAAKFAKPQASVAGHRAGCPETPLFQDFVQTWVSENKMAWRRSHFATLSSTLDRHLIPAFGNKEVGSITKADVLSFRSTLDKVQGRNGNTSLSAKTINRIIQLLGQILGEAADRYEFNNPVLRVKRLKQKRVDIHPFSIQEVRDIISTVRSDYQHYMTVRFFTGMRTGELHGLKWKYVDFERRQILIRETIVRGEQDDTKTYGSVREIDMSLPVFEALQAQHKATGRLGVYVFCNRNGDPIDLDNFTNRVWYPLLRHMGLDKRRPYQTRHTAATLWLGSGENPEYVARQLGHTNTVMLFRTYSRYVPNLTRRDGSAFDRFVSGALHQEDDNEA